MHKSKKLRSFAILGIVLLSTSGCFFTQQKKNTQSISTKDPKCSEKYDPVCGVDGKTYSNECYAAQQNNVAVAHKGECQTPSQLTDDERKHLMWLLRQREEAGFAAESVRHSETIIRDLSDGHEIAFYYEWDSGSTQALIVVDASGEIQSAVDTTGYDYLNQTRGEPVSFPELE